jgi:hypothetical protein
MNRREIARELGKLCARRAPTVAEQGYREEIALLAARLGVLIADDGCGTGWRLLGADGEPLMPEPGAVFADQGCARAFWYGLGRPSGARLHGVVELFREDDDPDADEPPAAPPGRAR